MFAVTSISGRSQDLTINLCIEWREGYDYFKNNSTIYEPVLIITYSNLSNNHYYLLKATSSPTEFPLMIPGAVVHSISKYDSINYQGAAMLAQNCCRGNYFVLIGGGGFVNSAWVAYPDSVYLSSDYEIGIDFINNSIEDIHSYLCLLRFGDPNYNDSEIYFREELLTRKRIMENQYNQFVFLDPRESHADVFSLIAFKKVGGVFQFLVSPTYQPDSVCVEPIWDSKNNKVLELKKKLPSNIGKYGLYQGEIIKNELFIDFNLNRR
jgi:hypothetical protein